MNYPYRTIISNSSRRSVPSLVLVIGEHIYNILPLFKEGEDSKGCKVIEQVKKLGAHNGKECRQHLLDHQDEIPVEMRGKITFVFTDDHPTGDSNVVTCVFWDGNCWFMGWYWLDFSCSDYEYVLRNYKQ